MPQFEQDPYTEKEKISKSQKEELLKLAKERFKYSMEADQEEHEQAYDDLIFAVNDKNAQWPSKLKQEREADGRPCLVNNKLPEKIDQVEGEFRQLRPSIKVRAVDSQADPKVAEIRAGLIRHIEYNSDARRAYNFSHSSVLFCGRGAWRIDIERAEDDPFERDIKINRITNVFSVYFDPNAQQVDKSDARFVLVTSMIGEQEFKSQYPNVALRDWDTVDEKDTNWRDGENVRVAEYFYKEFEIVNYFQVRRYNGFDVETMTVKGEENIFENDVVTNQAKVKVPKIKWCKLVETDIIEGPYEYPGKYLPIVIQTGKEVNVRGQQKLRGMVRFAKDPQRMYNYWNSTITEQVALSPKAPYLVTGNMLNNYQDIWDSAHKNNYFYLPFDIDPNNPNMMPKREQPPQMSSALAHELARQDHDIMTSMGIYEASLGDRGDEKSGKAIVARQKQGSIGSYTFTDHFEAAMVYSGKVINDLIPHVYSSERLVRILGEDGSEKEVPINARRQMVQQAQVPQDFVAGPRQGVTEYWNDLTVGKYDIRVTIGPSYTTQRQEAAQMLIELAGTVPQLAQVTIDLIVKNLDMPGADELLKRARSIVLASGMVKPEPGEEDPPEPPPDPEAIAKMQETQIKMKELELKMGELQLKTQKEEREDFSAEIDAIKKITEAQATQTDAAMNEMKGQMETIKGYVEAVRAEQDKENVG